MLLSFFKLNLKADNDRKVYAAVFLCLNSPLTVCNLELKCKAAA